MRKKKKRVLAKEVCHEEEQMNRTGLSTTDPLGSYTGRPTDPYEIPVQDADDL